MRLVFSNGKWLNVNIPLNPCWSPSDTWYYATMWAAGIRKGLDEKKATVVAEAATTKRMFPDIVFDSVLEKSISDLVGLEAASDSP
jgi:hypothetical protein